MKKVQNINQNINQTPLDNINKLLLDGMNNYKPNKMKFHKNKIKTQIKTPLDDIIRVLTRNTRKQKKQKKQKGGAYQLDKLLKSQKEEVEIRCDNPPSTSNIKFIKNSELHADPSLGIPAPNDVIIYLARFKKDMTGATSKNNKVVNINKTLDVYGQTYHLSAAVIHSGTVGGGHYWALAKRGNNKWVMLDDKSPPAPITDAEMQDQLSGKTSGRNGVLFLYRKSDNITIKYSDGSLNDGNGIENIGNSCYFNAVLQFLITTDEYQDKSKMEKTRKALYDFLTSATEKTGGQPINDGTFLQGFGPPGKKDVLAFGLKQECTQDAQEALANLFEYEEFKYNDTTPIIYEKNKQLSLGTYSELPSDAQSFTSNPPFFKYLFRETLVPKNSQQCTHSKDKPVVETIIVKLDLPKIRGTSSGTTSTTSISTRSSITNIDNNNKPKKKPKDKLVLYKGKDTSGSKIEEYDHEEDKKKYEDLNNDGLDRVEKQFELMSEIIPKTAVGDTKRAIVGKDMVEKLVIHENNLKLMINNLKQNADILKQQKVIAADKAPAAYAGALADINEKEQDINARVNEINILFKRLFHRRRKMAPVPTVWVN